MEKKGDYRYKIYSRKLQQVFTEIGPTLTKKVDSSSSNFHQYLEAYNITQQDIFNPLHIFNVSLQNGTFPDELKIARVTPLFKNGSDSDLGNYRPISVLPCFSKILEKIMYNRLYKHLSDNNVLYKKQFGFQEKHSTEHAILHLVDQINCSFEKNLFTLGIFIDLSKAFDIVDHKILITKLENYGVKGTNLQWFKSYLENRKQFIAYENFSTSYMNISCGMP